jgi:hypothetical protein
MKYSNFRKINQDVLNLFPLPTTLSPTKMEYYSAGVVAYAKALDYELSSLAKKHDDEKELYYKVSFIPKLGDVEFSVLTDSLSTAKNQLSAISDYTLFLHDRGLMPDYSNTGFISQIIDGEWEGVEDDE